MFLFKEHELPRIPSTTKLLQFTLLGAAVLLPVYSRQAVAASAATTTTLALSLFEVASGAVVTMTASVQTLVPVTVGQVNFCDGTAVHCTDSHLLGTAELTSAGTATVRFVPGAGIHTYKAAFLGTGVAESSSSTSLTLNVSGVHPTVTTISNVGDPGNYTHTASVASVAGSAFDATTGTVSFLDPTNAGLFPWIFGVGPRCNIPESVAVVDDAHFVKGNAGPPTSQPHADRFPMLTSGLLPATDRLDSCIARPWPLRTHYLGHESLLVINTNRRSVRSHRLTVPLMGHCTLRESA